MTMDDILYDLRPLVDWLVRGGWIWIGLIMVAIAFWAFKGR